MKTEGQIQNLRRTPDQLLPRLLSGQVEVRRRESGGNWLGSAEQISCPCVTVIRKSVHSPVRQHKSDGTEECAMARGWTRSSCTCDLLSGG